MAVIPPIEGVPAHAENNTTVAGADYSSVPATVDGAARQRAMPRTPRSAAAYVHESHPPGETRYRYRHALSARLALRLLANTVAAAPPSRAATAMNIAMPAAPVLGSSVTFFTLSTVAVDLSLEMVTSLNKS